LHSKNCAITMHKVPIKRSQKKKTSRQSDLLLTCYQINQFLDWIKLLNLYLQELGYNQTTILQ
jgi:hypothetical protein